MTNATKSLLLAVLSFFIMADSASACGEPPPELIKHHRDLVADSSQIVLARALTPQPFAGVVLPRFETIEVLKGEDVSEFNLESGPGLDSSTWAQHPFDSSESDFNGHRHLAFWDQGLTRQWNDTDCMMRPWFEPGETYLLFVDHPHWRAYELIRREEDLWLKAVRNLIADPRRPAGLAVTVPQWLSLAPRAFIVRAASCETGELEVVEVLLGEAEGNGGLTKQSQTRYHGSRGTCEVGSRFLVIVYYESGLDPTYKVSALFDVDNGTVDFSKAIDGEMRNGTHVGGTELEVIGEKTWSLEELREELSKKSQP